MTRQMGDERLLWPCWLLLWSACWAAAAGCPIRECSCETNNGKSIINCRMKDLRAVPAITPSEESFYELTLAHNSIRTLESNTFRGLKIEVLDLSENPIATINNDAFVGLEGSLKELILHVQTMSSFPSVAINRLANLKKIVFKGFSLNSLPADSFSNLNQLESLTIQESSLAVISNEVMIPIKNSLLSLNLNGNKLKSLPASLSQLSKLEKLMLYGNEITSLNAGSFISNNRLRQLDISGNGLNFINQAAFNGINGSLNELHLHNNKLTSNQLAPLSQLVALTVLDLSYNSEVTSLPDRVFAQLTTLRELKLTGCKVQAIGERSFEGLSNLLDLDMSGNDLSAIDSRAFVPLTSLQSLELDNQPNLVNALQENTLTPVAGTLQNLSLESTGFHSGKWSTISKLQNLKNLDISNNDLRSLPDFGLTKLRSLTSIDVSGNNLAEITQVKMHGPQSTLRKVTLDHNNIKTIDKCVFEEFNLERISLSRNPLRCDCRLKWLRQWLKDKYPGLNLLQIDWKCSEPEHHNNKYVRDLEVGDFYCDPPEDDHTCQPVTPAPTSSTSVETSDISTLSTASQPTNSPLLVNVSNVTHNSCWLYWQIQRDVDGFIVEYSKFKEYVNLAKLELNANARSTLIEDLQPQTLYIMCVQIKPAQEQACVDVETMPAPKFEESRGSATGAIIGGILGGLVFILVALVVAFLLWRRREAKEKGSSTGGLFHTAASGSLPSAGQRPQMGYNSKRFSRARTLSTDCQNVSNADFESKMAQLSREERDKILNFLTHSGGSTLSMISTGSSQRYVPDLPPRPAHLEGYLNPVSVKSDESSDSIEEHVYSEIGNNYAELGAAAHYDNNNLRKNEPVPPIPEDSYI